MGHKSLETTIWYLGAAALVPASAHGMVHWEQLLQNMRGTRFDEALGIVSERNASQEGVRLLLPSAP